MAVEDLQAIHERFSSANEAEYRERLLHLQTMVGPQKFMEIVDFLTLEDSLMQQATAKELDKPRSPEMVMLVKKLIVDLDEKTIDEFHTLATLVKIRHIDRQLSLMVPDILRLLNR